MVLLTNDKAQEKARSVTPEIAAIERMVLDDVRLQTEEFRQAIMRALGPEIAAEIFDKRGAVRAEVAATLNGRMIGQMAEGHLNVGELLKTADVSAEELLRNFPAGHPMYGMRTTVAPNTLLANVAAEDAQRYIRFYNYLHSTGRNSAELESTLDPLTNAQIERVTALYDLKDLELKFTENDDTVLTNFESSTFDVTQNNYAKCNTTLQDAYVHFTQQQSNTQIKQANVTALQQEKNDAVAAPSRVQTLEAGVATKEQTYEDAELDLKTKKREHDNAEVKLTELQKELTQLQKDKRRIEGEILDLDGDITDLTEEIKNLDSRLDALTEDQQKAGKDRPLQQSRYATEQRLSTAKSQLRKLNRQSITDDDITVKQTEIQNFTTGDYQDKRDDARDAQQTQRTAKSDLTTAKNDLNSAKAHLRTPEQLQKIQEQIDKLTAEQKALAAVEQKSKTLLESLVNDHKKTLRASKDKWDKASSILNSGTPVLRFHYASRLKSIVDKEVPRLRRVYDRIQSMPIKKDNGRVPPRQLAREAAAMYLFAEYREFNNQEEQMINELVDQVMKVAIAATPKDRQIYAEANKGASDATAAATVATAAVLPQGFWANVRKRILPNKIDWNS